MPAGLHRKLFASIAVMALLIVGAMFLVTETTVRRMLEEKLSRHAFVIGRQLASGSETGILTREHVLLSLRLRELVREEAGVEYAYLLDPDGTVIAHSFEGGFPVGLARANSMSEGAPARIRRLRTGRGDILDAAVPIHGGRLGSAHVGLSGELVERDVNELLRTILLVCVAIIGSMALLGTFIGTSLTKPVLELARLVKRVKEGSFDERAVVRSHDEVGDLATAFNDMIEARGAHNRDRERLVVELREALDNVKMLSGFLPICAYCKKIRDDRGYWSAIEQYISEHSEAQFSHGICDDCMKKQHPEFVPKDNG